MLRSRLRDKQKHGLPILKLNGKLTPRCKMKLSDKQKLLKDKLKLRGKAKRLKDKLKFEDN
jgi:hypothetical protein